MFRSLYRSTTSQSIIQRRYSASVLHITDSEGHYPSFAASIAGSRIVQFNHHGLLNFHPSEKNPFFIYGGDVTDRGKGDLQLLKNLLDFKKRHFDRVFLLIGNREASKTRFHTELHPKYIRERLINGTAPYWLQSRPHTVPLDYVKNHMIKNGIIPKNIEEMTQYVNSLHFKECQLIYLMWMLEENLSCPHTFSYHREQLASTLGKNAYDISNYTVLDSFLELTSPHGPVGEYLQFAQAGVIIPDTGILAVHGGLTPVNTGRIPGMMPTDIPITNAVEWINQFNSWLQTEVKKWVKSEPAKQELQLRAASSTLDTFSMIIPSPFRTVVTASMLNENRQFIAVPEEVGTYLANNKISIVLTGHQPCGDHPAILRSQDGRVVFINGDTSYANSAARNEHDTRGAAYHTTQIFSEDESIKVEIDARLLIQENIFTEINFVKGKIQDKHAVGKLLPDNQLVQCQLNNGNYRIIHQNGFDVRYSILTPIEVEEKLNLSESISPRFK